MKPLVSKLFFIALAFLFLLIPPRPSYGAEFFSIQQFETQIQLTDTTAFHVRESITITFTEPRHGIFRAIPIQYKNAQGFTYDLHLNVTGVTDEKGNAYEYTTRRQGKNLEIKIGSPDFFAQGTNVYRIDYTVKNGIRFFEDHDELYWNVTGTEWDVPIEVAGGFIALPRSNSTTIFDGTCFTGRFGSQGQDCTVNPVENGISSFQTTRPLAPAEGITIAYRFPKETFLHPPLSSRVRDFFMANGLFAMPVVAFFFLLRKFLREGREFPERRTIVPQFDPPEGTTPAEVGSLIDFKLDMRDITAEIIDLAVKGHLTITEVEKKKFLGATTDYQLTPIQKKDQTAFSLYQRQLMTALFGSQQNAAVTVSGLKNRFYKKVPAIREKLYDEMIRKDFFVKNPQKVRHTYWIIAAVLAGIGYLSGSYRLDFFVASVATGVLFAIFGIFMPKRGKRGADAHWRAMGLKEYINTAERYRVRFQEDKHIFERFLPYAMVFGLADKWAKAFEGIYIDPPSWYYGSFTGNFTTYMLINALSDFRTTANTAMTSHPSSSGSSGFSGGGFSGGGFGGGGGGSW